jgi:hypothetical protein
MGSEEKKRRKTRKKTSLFGDKYNDGVSVFNWIIALHNTPQLDCYFTNILLSPTNNTLCTTATTVFVEYLETLILTWE